MPACPPNCKCHIEGRYTCAPSIFIETISPEPTFNDLVPDDLWGVKETVEAELRALVSDRERLFLALLVAQKYDSMEELVMYLHDGIAEVEDEIVRAAANLVGLDAN